MTKEELAAQLNGGEYGNVINGAQASAAKASGLVVVYGHSDDLMEFEGAISDELGAFGGAEVYVTPEGLFEECESECKYSEAAKAKAVKVEAVWNDDGEYTWLIKTTIPHATFAVYEDGEKFCKGVVFALADVAKSSTVESATPTTSASESTT